MEEKIQEAWLAGTHSRTNPGAKLLRRKLPPALDEQGVLRRRVEEAPLLMLECSPVGWPGRAGQGVGRAAR